MDDPNCKYSIALPDTDPLRRLWIDSLLSPQKDRDYSVVYLAFRTV
jgi:hypothetical protein